MNPNYWTKGRLWPVRDGTILNDARPAHIIPPYAGAVEAVRDAYRMHLAAELHSVYIIGSVARGLAVAGLSDMDTVAAVHETPDMDGSPWQDDVDAAICQRFPCVSRVQFEMVAVEKFIQLDHFDIAAFTIKTQSVCVAGKDLAPSLPNFRADATVANDHVVQMRPDIEEAIAELCANRDAPSVRYWCRRIMKNIIRTGFALLMVERGIYTSDIHPCYQAFASQWPEYEAEMRHAVGWVERPTSDALEVIGFLEDFGQWMITRSDAWLDDYNPEREFALPLK